MGAWKRVWNQVLTWPSAVGVGGREGTVQKNIETHRYVRDSQIFAIGIVW